MKTLIFSQDLFKPKKRYFKPFLYYFLHAVFLSFIDFKSMVSYNFDRW